jgi:hypothetical protein
MSSPQPVRDLGHLILTLRGQRVLFDSDLAALYGVSTGNLNKAVRRNLDRFPGDFMFQLHSEEVEALRFQSGTSNKGRGGRRYLTQEGVAMLSSVLSSSRAVQVNIAIMRAFIRLRQMALSVDELSRKVADLERGYKQHGQQFDVVFKAIRQLMSPPPESPRKKIGF